MEAPTIEASGLTKTYGEVTALGGVDFSVAAGEVLAYLGRNGSGKTTTVRILSTLTRPTAGMALVGGLDVVRRPADVRRIIGVTMQSAAIDPAMTGRQHLELCAGLLGLGPAARRSCSDELLERFGLTDAATRPVRGWSGGMQRRLDLATALLREPRILFLDEPTTGLDIQSRRALWDEIRGLRDRGATILLTTQYLEEADQLADRVAVLHRGSLVALDTPDALKARHASTTLLVELEDAADVGRARDILVADGLAVELDDTRSCAVRVQLAGATNAQGIDAALRLRSAGVTLRSVVVHEPTMDDVFLALTGVAIEHEVAA